MRPLIVVITVPLLGYPFHFLYASEDVRIKYSPSVTAIEPFYISVLGRTSRQGVQNAYVVPFAPFLEILRNELRAAIVSDIFRLAVQPDYISNVFITLLAEKDIETSWDTATLSLSSIMFSTRNFRPHSMTSPTKSRGHVVLG